MSGSTGAELPPLFASLLQDEPDDRPVPALGLGDQQAGTLLLAATRAVLLAERDEDVAAAVGRFCLGLGADLVLASRDRGRALPLDVSLGCAPPVLADAEVLSVTRMRLEQLLPTLVEDARCAVSRLRRLAELETAERS